MARTRAVLAALLAFAVALSAVAPAAALGGRHSALDEPGGFFAAVWRDVLDLLRGLLPAPAASGEPRPAIAADEPPPPQPGSRLGMDPNG